MGMVNSQHCVIGVGSLDRFVRQFFLWSDVWTMYLVRSDKCGAHNLLKPEVLSLGPRWRIRWYVRVYQSRDETESLFRPDLYSSTRCIIPYINGSELISLYTCNTSWCSVHYMILNKPLWCCSLRAHHFCIPEIDVPNLGFFLIPLVESFVLKV